MFAVQTFTFTSFTLYSRKFCLLCTFGVLLFKYFNAGNAVTHVWGLLMLQEEGRVEHEVCIRACCVCAARSKTLFSMLTARCCVNSECVKSSEFISNGGISLYKMYRYLSIIIINKHLGFRV